MPRSNQAKRKGTSKERVIRVVPDEEGFRMPRAYANYVLVAHSPDDFTVYFGEIQDVSAENEGLRLDGDVYRAPIVAKIAMSPCFVPKLIDALRANYEKFQGRSKK